MPRSTSMELPSKFAKSRDASLRCDVPFWQPTDGPKQAICAVFNKSKTTRTPNKNGSHGIKGRFVCHILGSVCHIFCRNPLILRDFYAIRTPLYGIFWGHIFCKYGGRGGSELFSSVICIAEPCPSFPCFFFWISLFFSPCEDFLVFSSVFPFFSRDFRGSVGIKNLFFLLVFPAFFLKNKERKDRENHLCDACIFSLRFAATMQASLRVRCCDVVNLGSNILVRGDHPNS